MNLVLKSPDDAPYEAGKDFSVLISFDDSVTAERADYVLEILGRKLKDEEGRLFHQWWNTEVLAFTQLRELAALEAALADMIIIVIHQARQLPDMVAAWLKRALALREHRPGALVAMLDSDSDNPRSSQALVSQLKNAADLAHMDFFATRAGAAAEVGVGLAVAEVASHIASGRRQRQPHRQPLAP